MLRKSKPLFLSFIYIMVSVLLLATFSYSWIRRDWDAEVEEENIQIQTGGSLAIRIENEDGTVDTFNKVSLNKIVNATSFELKQVSNFTGESDDFFMVDYSNGIGNEVIRHIGKQENQSYTELGMNYGYIEVRFMLIGSQEGVDATQYIFLSENSYLEKSLNGETDPVPEGEIDYNEEVLKAIRISITIEGISHGDNPNTTLNIKYNDEYHSAITNEKDESGNYIANEKYLRTDDGEIDLENIRMEPNFYEDTKNTKVNFKTLDYYRSFCTSSYDEDGRLVQTYDTSRALFTLDKGEQRWISIRVWLEGQDAACTDEIAGRLFNMSLCFASISENRILDEGAGA